MKKQAAIVKAKMVKAKMVKARRLSAQQELSCSQLCNAEITNAGERTACFEMCGGGSAVVTDPTTGGAAGCTDDPTYEHNGYKCGSCTRPPSQRYPAASALSVWPPTGRRGA